MTIYDLSGDWGFGTTPQITDTIFLPGTTAQACKGERNHERSTGYLTEKYPYEGKAYYEKQVQIAEKEIGKPAFLTLERTRKTRVWADGQEVPCDAADSLTTPHVYDLTDYIHQTEITILIEVDNTDYPIAGGHLTSPDTQTNWNGITGAILLKVYDDVYLSHVRTHYVGELPEGGYGVDFRLTIENHGAMCSPMITIACGEESTEAALRLNHGENKTQIRFTFQDKPELWDEYTPTLHRFEIRLEGNTYTHDTGFRSFEAKGHYFYINGHRTMLRGKHDAMIFPIEGTAPTEVEGWLHVMRIAKEYGINHYRFHTCCPPDAAFTAADMLGIYMEPELPFWGTVLEEGDEGYDESAGLAWQYLLKEGLRMLECFGNHPSFVMMSLGNELWGSKRRMGEAIELFRAADDRHLYTQGSNNFQFVPEVLPQEDYFVGVRLAATDEQGHNDRLIRGSCACCDAPMGHVQTDKPNTRHRYDHAICPEDERWKPQLPVVSHEIGQYEMYPDYDEIAHYTGVLEAANLEIFKERLEAAGMGDEADEFFYNSGMLSMQCYREELEAAHRSDLLAGYQILDLQDYTGQGTALVGVLNSFMENKGLLSPEGWRCFCSDCVLLGEFDDYCVEEGTEFGWDMELSYHRYPMPAKENWMIKWSLSLDDNVLIQGTTPLGASGTGLLHIGTQRVTLPEVEMPTPMTLHMYLPQTAAEQNYHLWLYPSNHNVTLREGELSDHAFATKDAALAQQYYRNGWRVLYIEETPPEGIAGMYCTDFWNYPMFRSICEDKGVEPPTGTLGLVIRNTHPALGAFPSETYATPQWYEIVTHSTAKVLPRWEKPMQRPLVQVIDNVERNLRLGILMEERNEQGGVLLTTTTRLDEIMGCVEGRQYVRSLYHYLLGSHLTKKLY